ncbi:hypothetical protein ACFO5K_19065 [Nocardia halotolerans]|uniref:Uncharacterized protein n=1 Tax=Nocardia halotolerans TaxID=1755878 RepID=A0ABV8VK92_9NOCA
MTQQLQLRGVGAGTGVVDANSSETVVVRLRIDDALGGAETFLIEPGRTTREVMVRGADARGVAYGLSELADRVRYGGDPIDTIRTARAEVRSPAVPMRGVLRSFSSDVLDLPWLLDRDFWTTYLDELATHRINRLHLAFGMQYNFSHDTDVRDNYLCFAYPFLVEVPQWQNVGVTGLSDAERAHNLAALRFAAEEAARRGIHFQLGLWNHAVRPELADSPDLRYPITGLADQDIAEYSAAALGVLLRECPAIAGLTFRVHYEGGIPEAGRVAFWRTVMGGLRDVDRELDIDLHAKGVDRDLIETAAGTGGRVILSAKYWAEHQGLPYHQAAIRPHETVRDDAGDELRGVTQNARRFTRYGYADFLRGDREFDVLFRVWPGTQRFLLWADPELFAGYGRMSTIGGATGVELCEPLTFRGRKDSGRTGEARDLYADPRLTLGRADWEKYAYAYRLWGRLLFDPDAERESWLRYLRAHFGTAAEHVEQALSAAGKILPLVTVTGPASASNNFFWPEVFTDHPIAHGAMSKAYAWDLVPPRTWGTISPLDPALFECADDYARGLIDGHPSGRYTPDQVVSWLHRLADRAEAAIEAARDTAPDPDAPAFRRVEVDVRAQSLLGRFFAGKFSAGVGYALFQLTDDPQHLLDGIDRYRRGRSALADLVAITREVYVSDLAFGKRPTEHGHWSDRLRQVDDDLAELTREVSTAQEHDRTVRFHPSRHTPQVPTARIRCTPSPHFTPGRPLAIEAYAPASIELTVHVRHLDQAEQYREIPMRAVARDQHTAQVPAQFTDGPYDIQFYLLARDRDERAAWIVPGFDESLANQPYFVIAAGISTS